MIFIKTKKTFSLKSNTVDLIATLEYKFIDK